MQEVFWLEEGALAGRCGPNKVDWDLAQLKQVGIGAILSVNGGEAVDVDELSTMGIDYACYPFSANIPPQPGDLEICVAQVPKALAFIHACQQQGKAVLVHCRSGKDRTGLLMAYYLMERGAAPVHAVSQVRVAREIAFSADGWDQFAFDVLYALQE
ncbi:dual specificity protein phosphatase family protein [Shewanella waksmanii]|uniref:dual specificity protein phosphatase family protein n=1 Tax=Shewanella waksmanii TaxID=213783 RepID=UPI00048ED706|nr:dual specificity protein phosphatase family protein [Shewanella waksmanii]